MEEGFFPSPVHAVGISWPEICISFPVVESMNYRKLTDAPFDPTIPLSRS